MNPQILVQPYYFCLSLGFPFGFISVSWNKLLHFIIRFLIGFQHSHYFISDFLRVLDSLWLLFMFWLYFLI